MGEESGKVNERMEATVWVDFANGMKAEFLIDTGFDGHLCVPESALQELNLKATTTAFIYGVGTRTEEYGMGKVDISWCAEKMEDIDFLVNDGDDFLLGTALLENKELYINYKNGEVLITENE